MKIKPKHLVASTVFLLSFAILLITISDYGLTWDEPYYIAHSDRLEQWFDLLIHNQAPFSDEAVSNLVHYDRYHNCHPPFYKLSAAFFKQIIGQFLYPNILYQYRVSTAFWSALLVAFIFLYLQRAYTSYLIAILGAGLFFTVPRFFAHMHLFTTDVIIVSLLFLSLYFFVFGKNSRWVIFGGLFAGALIASKFTGVLLFPILLLVAPCLSDRKEFAKRMALFVPAAVLSFMVFDIHLWVGFWQELSFYFSSVLERESVIPISTLFFGKVYSYHLPWYQPLVMLGISIPCVLIIFAFLSPIFGRFNRDRKFWLFEVLPCVFLLFIFVLPKTPKHDGIRLFSLAWPFLILLSVRGVCGISRFINVHIVNRFTPSASSAAVTLEKGVLAAFLSFALLLNVSALFSYHPYQLSYYNAAIGGSAGAAKKGFMISYWYDALDQTFIHRLNALFKNDPVVIYTYPNYNMLENNKILGLVSPAIKSTSNPLEADYILILNRIIDQQMSNFLQTHEAVITALTPEDVWILALVKNNQ